MKDFHDIEYDGIVLKFPKWFIDLNGLQPDLDALLKRISGEDVRSTMHPDPIRNIRELEDYSLKKTYIEAEAKRLKEWSDKRDEQQRKYDELEEIRIVTHPHSSINFGNSKGVNLFGVWYDEDQMFTRTGIKAEFQKLINEKLAKATQEELIEFYNTFNLGYKFNHKSKEFLTKDVLYQDAYCNLSCRYLQYRVVLPKDKNKPKGSWLEYYLCYGEDGGSSKDEGYHVRYNDYMFDFFANYERIDLYTFKRKDLI